MQKGKQATRGQRQIHTENRTTITYYTVASASTSAVCLLLNLFFFETSNWVGWTIASLIQLTAVGMMATMVKSVRNEKGQIVDAGLDLNDPDAFGEYCKDAIILCSALHLLSIISSLFYWILLVFPALLLFKLWTKILQPWFFAQSEESDEDNDKKQKKREKKIYVRR